MARHHESITVCPIADGGRGGQERFDGYHRIFTNNFASQKTLFGTDEADEENLGKTIRLINAISGGFKRVRDPKYQTEPRLSELENKPDQDGKAGHSGIGSGYVYLLQFALHDMTFTSIARRGVSADSSPTLNLRQTSLLLDTIYSAGPHEFPHAYVSAPRSSSSSEQRKELKLRKIGTSKQYPHLTGRRLDLPRGVSNNTTTKNTIPEQLDLLTADPRNDGNAIIAQITVAFSALHNSILGKLRALPHALRCKEEDEFDYARSLSTQIYHSILRKDLLRKFLHSDVWKFYESQWDAQSPFFFDAQSDRNSIPLEFAHAAGRLGHLMVRPIYHFRAGRRQRTIDTVRTTSVDLGFQDTSDAAERVIDWKLFFEQDFKRKMDGVRPTLPDFNWSLKIGFHIPIFFESETWFPEFPRELNITNNLRVSPGLTVKDLSRAAGVGLRSVEGIISSIQRKIEKYDPKKASPELRQLNNVLIEELFQKEAVSKIVDASIDSINEPNNRRLNQEQIDILKEDFPLFLYLIGESAHKEENGSRFGLLASIIFADVMYLAMSRAKSDLVDSKSGELMDAIFPDGRPESFLSALEFMSLDQDSPFFGLYPTE